MTLQIYSTSRLEANIFKGLTVEMRVIEYLEESGLKNYNTSSGRDVFHLLMRQNGLQ